MTSESKTLRVAHIVEGAIWGGIEAHLENLVTAIDWTQHQVELKVFLLYDGLLEERLRGRVSIDRARIPHRRSTIFWLRRSLATFRPDVVHAHGFTPEACAALLRGTGAGWPLVVTVHSDPGASPWRAPGRSVAASLGLWAVRRLAASRLIAVSLDVQERLVALGFSARRIVRIPNGVPAPGANEAEAARALRREFGVPSGAVVVGMVGRLEPIKGHVRFLKALAQLAEVGPAIEAWIVGEGPLRQALEQEAARLGVAPRVRFLGFRNDVGTVMAALDLGVFASDHEGIPFAALELMARKVPIVSFAVGGLPEIVRDGESGALVAPYEEAALAQAIAALATDADERRRRGLVAAADVRSRFSLAAMATDTLAVWRAL